MFKEQGKVVMVASNYQDTSTLLEFILGNLAAIESWERF